MTHLLLTPLVFVLIGPPLGAICFLLSSPSGDGVLLILGGYIVGSWPALVASFIYVALSAAIELIMRPIELPKIGGSALGVLASVAALLYCFPGEQWWVLSKTAKGLLLSGVLAGAAVGAISAKVADRLAQDMKSN